MHLAEEIGRIEPTLIVDLSDELRAKVSTQCDNCKTAIDTSKPKKPKAGEGATPNPAIQAELETGIDTGETKQYHFCDETCLYQFLGKRQNPAKKKKK
jgi:hypothetical protein